MLALCSDQGIDLRLLAGQDAGRCRADRDDPIVIELPLLVDVAGAADERDQREGRALHSTPRRPSEGMIGSDLKAERWE